MDCARADDPPPKEIRPSASRKRPPDHRLHWRAREFGLRSLCLESLIRFYTEEGDSMSDGREEREERKKRLEEEEKKPQDDRVDTDDLNEWEPEPNYS
jgi:hypothetical protein